MIASLSIFLPSHHISDTRATNYASAVANVQRNALSDFNIREIRDDFFQLSFSEKEKREKTHDAAAMP